MDDGRLWTAIIWIATVIISSIFIAALGVILPRKISSYKPKGIYKITTGIIKIAIYIATPFAYLSRCFSHILQYICGINAKDIEQSVTQEDIMSMVDEGHESGVLESNEAKMIHNIVELDDKEAMDIMTPRKNIVAIDDDITLADAMAFMLDRGRKSRYPVYHEDLDNITGILNMKDAVIFNRDYDNRIKKLSEIPELLRKAHFIPETHNLDDLFHYMQSQKVHMVLVVDEYGQTAGLVTMEDILEEIVGNIRDEYDLDDRMIIKYDDGTYIMRGLASLSDVSEALDITFDEEDEDFDTLSGYMIAKYDRIPDDGEQFSIVSHGYVFRALRVNDKMVAAIKVTKDKRTVQNDEERQMPIAAP